VQVGQPRRSTDERTDGRPAGTNDANVVRQTAREHVMMEPTDELAADAAMHSATQVKLLHAAPTSSGMYTRKARSFERRRRLYREVATACAFADGRSFVPPSDSAHAVAENSPTSAANSPGER
jgi:hypothetical protein